MSITHFYRILTVIISENKSSSPHCCLLQLLVRSTSRLRKLVSIRRKVFCITSIDTRAALSQWVSSSPNVIKSG